MVDAHASGACEETHGGSSPFIGKFFCKIFFCDIIVLLKIEYMCRRGGIGIRARLRGVWGNPCGFKSRRRHLFNRIKEFYMEQNPSIISSLEDTILTKDYVNSSYSKIGKEYSITIFLKDISSIIYGYQSKPILLLFAVISIILGIYLQNNYVDYALSWGIVIGIVLFVLFFVTKRQTIVVTAHSAQKIIQIINDREKAKKFIEDLIAAKAKV